MSTKLNLDGPKAKIARALEHHRQFNAALDDYIAQRPFGIRLDHAEDGWTSLTFIIREPIPLRLGAIFGDFVNNLESALDQLIGQLVVGSGNVISTGNYYPVVTTPERWPVARPDKLKGVKDEWADIIRDAQPFIDEPNIESHPLVVLHKANKISKHTLLMPAAVVNTEWEPTFKLNREAREGEHVVSELGTFGPTINHGDLLVRVRAISSDGDLKIAGWGSSAIPTWAGFGFADLVPDGTDFPDLAGYVIRVVDKFEDFASP